MLYTTVAIVLFYYIYAIRRKHDYWKNRGMKYEKPIFLFGNILRSILLMEPLEELLDKFYKKNSNDRYVCYYFGLRPVILLKDPKFIEQVLIKDFSHCPGHNISIDEKTNPLDGHLFNLEGKKWKTLRTKLSPTFTSGKLKWMYSQISDCGDLLVDYMKEKVGTEIEFNDTLARFTTDVIGSCAFGIEPMSIKDADSKFRQMGRRIFRPGALQMIKEFFRFIFPDIAIKFKFKSIPDDMYNFFVSITKDTFQHRLKTGTKRNDFMQLLLQLKEKGYVDYDQNDKQEAEEDLANEVVLEDDGKLEFTDELLAAQSFIFFAAGFDSTASALSIVAFYLGKNKHIQEKVRQEIREKKEKFNGITYDAVKEMEYLDACVKEGMRLYPPFPIMFRNCVKSLTLYDGTVLLPGESITISAYSIHRDPNIYPNPNSFLPERFLGNSPAPCTYLTFGDGPRICIAKRFAMLEAKLALAKILDNYEMSTGSKQIDPIVIDTKSFVTQAKGGIWIKLTGLKN